MTCTRDEELVAQHDAETYAPRRARFNAILDGYECGAGDWTAIGNMGGFADGKSQPASVRMPIDERLAHHVRPGRWALVSESCKGHGYFVENVNNRDDIERVAAKAYNSGDGWTPVCYFDLDELAGDPPAEIKAGDIVRLKGESDVPPFGVHSIDGEKLRDRDGSFARRDEVEVVEYADDRDERMPKRYAVALIQTVVAFNTVPTES